MFYDYFPGFNGCIYFLKFILYIIYSDLFFWWVCSSKRIDPVVGGWLCVFCLSCRRDIWCWTQNLEFQKKSCYGRIWVGVFAPKILGCWELSHVLPKKYCYTFFENIFLHNLWIAPDLKHILCILFLRIYGI